jgi:acyl carrier protein
LARVIEWPPDAAPGPDTVLVEGGLALDSVAILEFLLALEQEFDVELDPGALLQAQALRTIGSLAAFVEDLVNVDR